MDKDIIYQIKQCHVEAQRIQEENKKKIAALMSNEFLDSDGYPTDAALEIIELWPYSDAKGWFAFIKNIWYMASWGWREGKVDHEFRKDEQVYLYSISTAGWSGNESLIHSMEKNFQIWGLFWKSSRRGGHYEFELDIYEDG
jgi:hypothetical protein